MITALRGYTILRRLKETKTESGLYLPNADKSNVAEVVAVGEGLTLQNGEVRAPIVKVGDQVIFHTFTSKITVNGEELLVVEEDHILVIQ